MKVSTQALTVSQLNQHAKQVIERGLGQVAVMGEVSGSKTVSGHVYWTLKDNLSQLACVMFKRDVQAFLPLIKEGAEIVVEGKPTLYPPYGRYQMVVERVYPKGLGSLQAMFEALKAKLQAEGLCAVERKRALPKVPRCVAVITSPTGAVLRDIVHVATRRFEAPHILLVPTKVQGAECVPGLLAALKKVQEVAVYMPIDVVIIARGGGSIEDLWGFNDETFVRAVAACSIPTVSAVGHETDFTLCDCVADVRAPTPSAAAEYVFPVRAEWVHRIGLLQHRMRMAAEKAIQQQRYRLRVLRAELGDGRRFCQEHAQKIAHPLLRMEAALRKSLEKRRRVIETCEKHLVNQHPRQRLLRIKMALGRAEARMQSAVRRVLLLAKQRLGRLEDKTAALSPLGVLERGYGIVSRTDGHVVRNADEVHAEEGLRVRVHKGSFHVRVIKL